MSVDCPETGKNKLLPTDPVCPGAQWFAGGHLYDSTSYAVPKLAEERLAKCLSEAYPSKCLAFLAKVHISEGQQEVLFYLQGCGRRYDKVVWHSPDHFLAKKGKKEV